MKRVTFAQGCAGVFLLYCLLAAALYGIAGEQFFGGTDRRSPFQRAQPGRSR